MSFVLFVFAVAIAAIFGGLASTFLGRLGVGRTARVLCAFAVALFVGAMLGTLI